MSIEIQKSAQSGATPVSPFTPLSPRLPSPVFQSCFIQASDHPVELLPAAQKFICILPSGRASLPAKCTAHEKDFPPLLLSECVILLQFIFVCTSYEANPSIGWGSNFCPPIAMAVGNTPTGVNVS